MSKFNTQQQRPAAGRGPIVTDTRPTGSTGEGAPGYARDAKSELFLLAVANMVAEDTFYENAKTRDDRYETLIAQVAVTDPAWIAAFLAWLRTNGNLRSASLVGALEAARAMLAAQIPGGRAIVASVLQRPDEPGEALAYWLSRYGRTIPTPVKRGIADGALRLYTERALLKYDTGSHAVRFADVIELTHPGDRNANQRFKGDWQRDLFKHAIDRRHNRGNPTPETLTMPQANAALRERAVVDPVGALLDADLLRAAGMTWEDVLSLAGSTVPKAQLWEALIPSMGYMALLRNLRNFDDAGISDEWAASVAARLRDPEQVARSRQFPFRFLSAYNALGSLRWGDALEKALNHSLANVPELPGRTLVLVDRSASMTWGGISGKSKLNRADAASVFGVALALRNAGRADLVEYGTTSAAVPIRAGDSLLRVVRERFHDMGGTETAAAVLKNYAGHDRVVIVTDEQAYVHQGDPGSVIPATVPLYTWNLAGYRYGHGPGAPLRHTFGGMTDAAFKMIPLLEAGRNGTWPWETN